MLKELKRLDDIRRLSVGTQIFLINRYIYHSYIVSGQFGEYRAVDGTDKIYLENRREKNIEDKLVEKSPDEWFRDLESVSVKKQGYVYVINPFPENDRFRIFRIE
jgi:hypothetical protein